MECSRPLGLAPTLAVAIVTVSLALAAPLAGQVGADPTYRIGPNDEISIEVLEDENLNVQRRVSGAGRVSLPLVGELAVDGHTAEEVRAQIKAVLEKGIHFGGTSMRDYINSDGERGSFQEELFVYGRRGEGCFQCGSRIEKIVVSQRGTHFCPACQARSRPLRR